MWKWVRGGGSTECTRRGRRLEARCTTSYWGYPEKVFDMLDIVFLIWRWQNKVLRSSTDTREDKHSALRDVQKILWDPFSSRASDRPHKPLQISAGISLCHDVAEDSGLWKTKIKTKHNNETLSFKVFSLTLFALQSILSACGATRTLCGRRSIYRSVGRASVRLNCKQVPSRDWLTQQRLHIPDRLIHPLRERPRAGSSTAAWWIPNKSDRNRKKSFESRWRKRGCRWLEWSLLQHILSRPAKNNKKRPPSPPLLSPPFLPLSLLLISKAIRREGESTRKQQPFVHGCFCMRESPVFCLWDNIVLPLRL